MPVFQQLVNFDEMFRYLKHPPIIINDLANNTLTEREHIRDLIQVKFTSDMLNILPTCKCGNLRGEYVIGDTCDICNTVVKPSVEDDVEPIVWFRSPEGVEKLINPIIFLMLEKFFKKSNFNILRWLCDKNYHSIYKTPKIANLILEANIERGYNNFVTNFDRIIDFLFNHKEYKKQGNAKLEKEALIELINRNRDCIFSEYIPLPNRSLLVIEKTNLGVYVADNIVVAIDGILTVAGIDFNNKDKNSKIKYRNRDSRAIKTIIKLTEFYSEYNKTTLTGKLGTFRKHLFGSRTHFSFRAVITSLTARHRYNEIHIPWGIAISLFRIHLLNKLLKRGYEHNQAIGFLYSHVENYSPLLDEIFHELINEAPDNLGIPILMQRNPSLLSGSAQLIYVSHVKTDPSCKSVSVPITIITAPNADFDGDVLNFTLTIDNKMSGFWYNLSPHKNVLICNRPRELSKNIRLPETLLATISNWLSDKENDIFTEEQINNFNSLQTL